jgi:branched-chain amino acid transport system permease protein
MDRRSQVVFFGVVLFTLLVLPFLAERALLRMMTEFFFLLTLAQLWNLLAGYAGLVSVGQHAAVGIGGYAMFLLTINLGLPVPLAVLAAGLVAAVAGAAIFLLVSRLSGAYFSIGTWVVAEIFALVALQTSIVGGATGMSLPPAIVKSISADAWTREAIVYTLALTIAVGTLAGIVALMAGRFGLALRAIRDNPRTASSVGVDIARVKLLVFVAVAACAGIVGAVLFFQKLRISPGAAFSLNEFTAIVIFVVIVGGLGTMAGPIIGTVIYFVIREALADFGSLYLIALGAIAVIVVIAFPEGVWGEVRRRLPTDRWRRRMDGQKNQAS